MSRKLHLDADALRVESFAAGAVAEAARGTVAAHAATRRLCTGRECEETRYMCPSFDIEC